jgi:pSer/pThr/pTyr-binding forkhead associated (FHA) protein
MSPLPRLFGRKSEPEKKAEPGKAEKKTAPAKADNQAGMQVTAKIQVGQKTPEPEYGLNFVLDKGETKSFSSLPITIGRSEQNTFIVSEETVSSTHARVYYDERVKGICIEDLDSLSGLFINGSPTRKNLLLDGMKIRMGNMNITFRDTGYIHPGSR